MSKYDPLKTYEAKTAIQSSDKDADKSIGEEAAVQKTIMLEAELGRMESQEQKEDNTGAHFPSPVTGTQEGPTVDMSS